jgi:hypothetical protein
VLESLGSELYAHFTVTTDQQIESQELRELAEDVGGGEVPMAGEEGHIVARLDPQSGVRVGQESELWVDATRIHLFDPEDGRNLTTDARGPAATDGGQGAGGRDPDVPPREDERPAEGTEARPGGFEERPPSQPR